MKLFSLTYLGIIVISFFGFTQINAEEDSPVRLCGVVQLNGEYLFSLQSTDGQHKAWVGLKQPFLRGHVLRYVRENREVIFAWGETSYSIRIADQAGFAAPVFDEELAELRDYNNDPNLESYSMVPEGVKAMPAENLIEFLVNEGYRIPERILIKARSEMASAQPSKEDPFERAGREESETAYSGPRAPLITTSMTREVKILRGIVGYQTSNSKTHRPE